MLKPALARFESGGRMLKPVLGQIRIRAPDAETGGGQIRIRAIPDAGPTRFPHPPTVLLTKMGVLFFPT